MSTYDRVRANDSFYCPECHLPFPAFGVANIVRHLIMRHPNTPLGTELTEHQRLLAERRARRGLLEANFIG